MNIGPRPKFIDSPYFVGETDNWHLLDGAPQEVIDEFNEFMKYDENGKEGVMRLKIVMK